ncbi:MAG: ABC transporter ATP-binding protein, partial [Halobacteriota archaeon]
MSSTTETRLESRSRTGDAKIRAERLTKTYGEHLVFEDLELEVSEGETYCLLGPSGCGKTTLLDLLAGLERPTEGRVVFEGDEVNGPDHSRGVVFQDHHLYPWLTVRGNVEFGPRVRGESPDADHVDRLIRMIGLEEFEDARPAELSGGMAQRVSLARTLANDPELLLLDEPFSALDALTKMELQDELLGLMDNLDLTAVFVTHDVEEAVYVGDRVAVMGSGGDGVRAEVDVADVDSRDDEDFPG